MELNATETAILTGVYRDVERYAAAPWSTPGMRYGSHQQAAHRRRVSLGRDGAALPDFVAWRCGESSGAAAQRRSRAMRHLEELGYLERDNSGGRTCCLYITDAGREAARRLVESEPINSKENA